MKKLWIVLISLALVAAFCMPAAAVDVKFSGSYYVAGDYYGIKADKYGYGGGEGGDWSTAFFRQRLRVQTEFVVSPGLSLITRFDALEKVWGDNTWAGSRGDTFSRDSQGRNRALEQENIEFEQAYIQYMSKVGMWWIGYAPHDFWGTTFGDSTRTQALIQWILPMKWGMIGAKYFKSWEGSTRFTGNRDLAHDGNDYDDDAYVGIAMYKTQDIETGLKVAYRRIADNKGNPDNDPYNNSTLIPGTKIDGWLLTPYFIGQFGPVKLQAELEYWKGKTKSEYGAIAPNGDDQFDMSFLSAYLDGKVDLGPAYVGGRFIYASGAGFKDFLKGDLKGSNFSDAFEGCWGGVDLKQTLILWNEDVTNWLGNPTGVIQGNGIKNAWFYQLYGGYKWGDFDFAGALAYAKAVEDDTLQNGSRYQAKDSDYGWELDATVSYKITDNLSYMVGAGYLWAGDYFTPKGSDTAIINDIYVITNKLTLTF